MVLKRSIPDRSLVSAIFSESDDVEPTGLSTAYRQISTAITSEITATNAEVPVLHIHRRALLATLATATILPIQDASAQQTMGPFTLDPLPYPATQNEPYIDAETMTLHHDRHHAAYVANLNAAIATHGALAKMPLPDVLAGLNTLPEDVRAAVRNNGGGHANHTMFWQIMGGRGGEPEGDIRNAIDRDLGGFTKLQEDFNAAGSRIFGSGWVFVTVSKDGKLSLTTRPNQDTPLMDGERVLLGNDVWEHSYYLKYRNRRPDYLKAWWNVLNWEVIAQRYAAATAGTLGV
jgi:Fe-Mn family superoxide dismutase